jgi:TetR/AcrR family transcriptional repressor of nem operon
LEVARSLVFTRGYEQMAIQDILDRMQISKGAFYHYFTSKQSLLEALTLHLLEGAEQIINPIVQDPCLPTLEKLKLFFATLSNWKTGQKDFLLGLLHTWYSDENAIIRQKMQAMAIVRLVPVLQEMISQGIQEGVLTCQNPEQVSEVVITILQGLGDSLGKLILTGKPNPETLQRVERTLLAYTNALERVLGAPSGSLQITDMGTMKEWIL